MPFHEYKNRRGKPLIFFKGKPREIRALKADKIANILSAALGVLSPEQRADLPAKIRLLKRDILQKIKRLQESPDIYHHYSVFVFGDKKIQLRLDVQNGKAIISQFPLRHGVSGMHDDSYKNLMEILNRGFKGKASPNVELEATRKVTSEWAAKSGSVKTFGDRYTLELMSPAANTHGTYLPSLGFVGAAKPSEILRVVVALNHELTHAERTSRMKFYRKSLKGVPITFF